MLSVRSLKTTALLAAVSVLALPAAAAGAQTHRFRAATDVTVSFELPRAAASGTLVRFARNGLALTRSGGTLTLQASGRHARRLALPAHGAARVLVDVSAADGIARLSVARRSASMAGRFVAEDAVTVRNRRAVLALQIRTAAPSAAAGHTAATAARIDASTTSVSAPTGAAPTGAAPTGAAPTGAAPTGAAPTGAAPAGPAPAGAAPAPPAPPAVPPTPIFAPDSVWNAPLAAAAPLDPAGPQLVQKLLDTVAQNQAARTGPWIATNQSGTPLYRVAATQPLVRVQLHTGWWGDTLQTAYESVPVPADARPGTGADAHMVVWQPSTDRYWEFFHMRKLADGWHADYGGAIKDVSQSAGYFSTASWPGLSQSYWGATATSLPLAGGLMRIDELKAGTIPHALALAIPFARPRAWSFPAQRTDGTSSDPAGIPEGARFRIDPTLDLSKLKMPRVTRMMAVAAQRYGIVVVDQTGWAVGFRAEDNRPTGSDPYYGSGGLFGGLYPNDLLASFPWDHLLLMKMDLHTA